MPAARTGTGPAGKAVKSLPGACWCGNSPHRWWGMDIESVQQIQSKTMSALVPLACGSAPPRRPTFVWTAAVRRVTVWGLMSDAGHHPSHPICPSQTEVSQRSKPKPPFRTLRPYPKVAGLASGGQTHALSSARVARARGCARLWTGSLVTAQGGWGGGGGGCTAPPHRGPIDRTPPQAPRDGPEVTRTPNFRRNKNGQFWESMRRGGGGHAITCAPPPPPLPPAGPGGGRGTDRFQKLQPLRRVISSPPTVRLSGGL